MGIVPIENKRGSGKPKPFYLIKDGVLKTDALVNVVGITYSTVSGHFKYQNSQSGQGVARFPITIDLNKYANLKVIGYSSHSQSYIGMGVANTASASNYDGVTKRYAFNSTTEKEFTYPLEPNCPYVYVGTFYGTDSSIKPIGYIKDMWLEP